MVEGGAVQRRERLWSQWEALRERLLAGGLGPCQEVAPQALRLGGPGPALSLWAGVHGNEVGGWACLMAWLEEGLRGGLSFERPVMVVLANPEAVQAGVRYLEHDLNRSFGRSGAPCSGEQARAGELTDQVLRSSELLIDLHQTLRPSRGAFAIFPFTPGSFELARRVAPELPIVTHWGKRFSADGGCSDEMVQQLGGQGITLELGQAGTDPYQVGYGFWVLHRAARAWQRGELDLLGRRHAKLREEVSSDVGEVYTWAQVYTFPKSGEARLRPGLENFTALAPGEYLGICDGEPWRAPQQDGLRALFPIYPDPDSGQYDRAPLECLRVMRKIDPATALPWPL